MPRWAPPSTGYESINMIEGLCIDPQSEERLTSTMAELTGETRPFTHVVREAKKDVLDLFKGDIDNLVRFILPLTKGFTRSRVHSAVMELLISFDRYRSYASPRSKSAIGVVYDAVQEAKKNRPGSSKVLDALFQVLTSSPGKDCLFRLQQLTGPIMAKGLEDTALYRYCRLLGRNEVGCHDFTVSEDDFHSFARQYDGLVTGSTHDTKRGEDARARLHVLTEMPERWDMKVRMWREMNARHRKGTGNDLIPIPLHEYYLYQAMLASYPFDTEEQKGFCHRLQGHVRKAMRESKKVTSWLEPDEGYEEKVVSFTRAIFEDDGFMDHFLTFWDEVSWFGMFNALSCLILRHTIPGVPDVYNGAEVWNLSMTDPDNRRPVDFAERKKILASIKKVRDPHTLLTHYHDGRIKMYMLRTLLKLREQYPGLLEEGAYGRIRTDGQAKGHIIAFRREHKGTSLLVMVPRFFTSIMTQEYALSTGITRNIDISVPRGSYQNIFTGEKVMLGDVVRCDKVMTRFPFAVLVKR